MQNLCERIKKRRLELGLSQDELAKKLGYKSRSSINKIEMGVNDIPQSKIEAFAFVLDTTPMKLMGWEEKENPALAGVDEIVDENIKLFNKLTPDDRALAIKAFYALSNMPQEERNSWLEYFHFRAKRSNTD